MKIVRKYPGMVLAFLAVISLGFIVFTDRFLFNVLGGKNSSLAIVADIRLTSLTILFLVYHRLTKVYSFKFFKNVQIVRRSVLWGAVWLAMTAYFVLIKKVWVPSLQGWADFVAFMITGLIAEELLFRGILFDLSFLVFKKKTLLTISVPVLFTSVLFGLQHLSYHEFQITPASVTQVVYTTFMGIIFASIKESSGRLWPVIGFHMLNNSFTLIRNLG